MFQTFVVVRVMLIRQGFCPRNARCTKPENRPWAVFVSFCLLVDSIPETDRTTDHSHVLRAVTFSDSCLPSYYFTYVTIN